MKKTDPIMLMYHALMAIACIDPYLHPGERGAWRAREIASDALRQMNSEHTKAVQQALGIRRK